MINFKKIKIGIIGLGYVGLPLAIEFSKKFKLIGYDSNFKRINSLKKNIDLNNEMNFKETRYLKNIFLTRNIQILKDCNIFIVTVPTPIKKNKKPDLSFLKDACEKISTIIKKKDIIIFESTVFPGLTEEYCAKLIEKKSSLIFNKDFFCGYSPERINPGDNKKTIKNIIKITSGSNKKTADIVDKLYKTIIKAGTYKVSSIKVAEAAKVIENCQRDINIAFINELSLIFDKMNLNTNEIINAAKTKWNFLDFKPGLVGGHCVGVDPYYLTYKSTINGYRPKIILAGRKLNDSMGKWIAKKLIKNLKILSKTKSSYKVLIMGFSFKENCSDIRNTKVIDIYNELKNKRAKVDIYDPIANKEQAYNFYNMSINNPPKKNYYDAILIAVGHKLFRKMGIETIRKFGNKKSLVFDLKNLFTKNKTDITI